MMSSDESPKMESEKNPENSFVFQGEMDLKDKNALLQCRTRIIKDLDIRIVIDSLLESRVVDENLYERIKNEVSLIFFCVKFAWFLKTHFFWQPTIQDQARQLLDILPYRGPKAFPIFVDVLKEDYEWLADDLEEALTLKTEDVTDEVETDELIGMYNKTENEYQCWPRA